MASTWLIVLSVVLALVVCIKAATDDSAPADERKKRINCPPKVGGFLTNGQPEKPGPFDPLTEDELTEMEDHLSTVEKLNFNPDLNVSLLTSHIHLVDLWPPKKQDVLNFLKGTGPQPPREAIVYMFRGDKRDSQSVEEYKVGPLPNITYVELKRSVPFSLRPVSEIEFQEVEKIFKEKLDEPLSHLLNESFDARFTNCDSKCLTVLETPVNTVFLKTLQRMNYYTLAHKVEEPSLHPLDMGFLLQMDDADSSLWKVVKVYYAGKEYSSVEELMQRYNDSDNPIKKTKVPFPEVNRELFSTMNYRGKQNFTGVQRPPFQIDPDGKRFFIRNNQITYGKWVVNYRISTRKGPLLSYVRFDGELIAYEISIEEIVTNVYGAAPMNRFKNSFASSRAFGAQVRPLVPNVDCVEGSPMLDLSIILAGGRPKTIHRAACVMEVNSQNPETRHSSKDDYHFAAGMPMSYLVIRSCHAVGEKEFLIDWLFHQDGTVHPRISLTGVSSSATFSRPEENGYGWKTEKYLHQLITKHTVHIKVDLDVKGQKNRHEILEMKKGVVKVEPLTENGVKEIEQIKFDRILCKTEKDSVFAYNAYVPRIHIFYNNEVKNENGVPKAYRVRVEGSLPQLLTPGVSYNTLSSIPWANYEVAVTKHKDEEDSSSSYYADYDGYKPIAEFQDFIEDDENLIDEDAVTWFTAAMIDVPSSEVQPIISTDRSSVSVYVSPYNYNKESPLTQLSDNIRIELKDPSHPDKGLRVLRNGLKENGYCGVLSLSKLVQKSPEDFVSLRK